LAAVAIVLVARMRRERLAGRPVYALSLGDAASAWLAGARSMLVAAGILILAWSIRRVCDGLGTDVYVVASMRGAFDPIYLPIATFLAACGISFATGTAWGTMGILIPSVLPLAHALGGDALMVLSLAAVLDGAIFGDHCSPISDTTVLSSIASRCDHIDHVKTQMPYAALCMIAALGIGYLPAALGHHGWWSYAAAIAFLLAALFLAGRRTDAAGPAPKADHA
ncbi:MAG: Na+/H+ antiporter NhaC family protein, partial [Myxococcota bacterium]|nr:Na+/H+ antiporter NhaC family protein [Myxococcota bacterium]